MMNAKILGLLAVTLLAGLPEAANATLVTYDFETSGPYSGQFSYENTNSTVAPSVPNYNSNATWYAAISFVVNGNDVGPASIGIMDISDLFSIFVATNSGILRMNFFDLSGNLFAGEAISNADGRTLADFSLNTFVPNYDPALGMQNITYQVTSLLQRTTAVPEPGTLALLGLGLLSLGMSRRRKA